MGRPGLCGFLIYQIIKFKMLIKYYCFSKKKYAAGKSSVNSLPGETNHCVPQRMTFCSQKTIFKDFY